MSMTRTSIRKRLFLSLLVAALFAATWSVGKVSDVLAATDTAAAEAEVTVPAFPIPAISAQHQANENPNIIVIGTGGTLAGAATNGDKTSFQSYRAGTYPIQDMVDQLPGKEKIADVSTYQFGNKGSGGYTIADLYDLSLAVEQALETYDGAVVTTGTDTMEEIAYFLDLTVQSEKPVVVTGAMRPWDVIGTDGPANLYQAIKTAASGKTKWYGTVIMLNDMIHAAREVTKSNTHRMDTFETTMFGALGYVDDAGVRMYRLNGRAIKAGTDEWKTPFNLKTVNKSDLPFVGIVYNYQEAGGGAIKGLVAEGAKGIVTAGTGAGGISSALSAARAAAVRDNGVVFVSTSRTGSGSVYSSGNGIISGDNLDPQHARIMLMLTLAFTDDFEQMKTWFATVGTQEVEINVEQGEEPTPTPSAPPVTSPPVTSPTPTVPGEGAPTPTPTSTPTASPDPGEEIPDIVFTDTKGHWAEQAIAETVSLKIVEGYADGSFRPNGDVTRAEYTVMLMRMLGTTEDSGSPTAFTDETAIGPWAKPAVAAAVSKGIITGYSDGSFQPNRNINRMELVLMAARALELDSSSFSSTAFADDQQIAAWAKPAVAAAASKGIIQGKTNNRFDPAGTATRAEAVTIILNMNKAR